MLLYVAGPFSSYGDHTEEMNVEQAVAISAQLWEAGHAVICPHTNTQAQDRYLKARDDTNLGWETWLEGDEKIIQRCDGIVMTPDWEFSKGACREHAYAKGHGVPIWYWPVMPTVSLTERTRPIQVSAFLDIIFGMYRLHLRKNGDYSPANIAGCGETGVVVRLWDKMARLMNLSGFRIEIASSWFEAPREPENESIDDTYFDGATYNIIGLLVRRGQWGR